jgi:hypothetical protein
MNTLNSNDFTNFNQVYESLYKMMDNHMELAEKTTFTEQDLLENCNLLKGIFGMCKELEKTNIVRVARVVSTRTPRRTVRYNLDAKMALGINKEKGYVICEICDTPIKKSGLKAHQRTVSCKDKHLGKVGCHLHKKVICNKIIYEKLLGGHLQNRKMKVEEAIKKHTRQEVQRRNHLLYIKNLKRSNHRYYLTAKDNLFKFGFTRSDFNIYQESFPEHFVSVVCKKITSRHWYDNKKFDFDFDILRNWCLNHYQKMPNYDEMFLQQQSSLLKFRQIHNEDDRRRINKQDYDKWLTRCWNVGIDRRMLNNINKYFPTFFPDILHKYDELPRKYECVSLLYLKFFCRRHIKKVQLKMVQHLNQH